MLDLQITQPTESAPLVRRLRAVLSRPARLHVRRTDADHEVVTEVAASAQHDHLLLGWRPGRDYTVTIEAVASDGAVATRERTVRTEPLPDAFPEVEVTVVDPERMAPGDTLTTIRPFVRRGAVAEHEYVVVFDEEGEVVWLWSSPSYVQDAREIPEGLQIVAGSDDPHVAWIGWDGSLLRRWTINGDVGTRVQTELGGVFHHDAVRMSTEPVSLWSLGRGPRVVEDFAASYDNPLMVRTATVASDYVVHHELDGTVLHEIELASLLPLERIGYDSLRETTDGWVDWAHANAVLPHGGDVIVSMRHQDALVSIDPAGPSVRWILGNHDNWPEDLQDRLLTPIGEVRWPWHAHAPMVGPPAPDGQLRLVLFDNGNHQAAPFTGQPPLPDSEVRSRVVSYLVDGDAGTVRTEWSYDWSTVAGGPLFSGSLGDADWLPTGTVLATWGSLRRLPDGRLNEDAGLSKRSARLVEFDPVSGEDVWHLYLFDLAENRVDGWTTYRADRITSLVERPVR